MEKITRQAMTELLAVQGTEPVVTMYIPMHKSAAPPHMNEDQIRFKNLTNQAIDTLKVRGDELKLAKQLSDTLEQVMNDPHFWESQTQGLLLCARAGNVRMFHLPVDTEEYVAVDTCFHLTPVLGLLHDAQAFYVLSVAQHNPKLYKGTMYGLEETTIKLPESIQAGLNIDESNQKSEQSLSAGGSSMNTNAFNGRGGARNPQEDDRARFFRMVDHIIMQKADRSLPLILAGIDAETVEYRTLSKYPTILTGVMSGNYEHGKLDEMFEAATAIVRRELVSPKHQQVIEDYQRMHATTADRTAHDSTAIREAAEQGRVGTLLLGMSRFTTDTVRDSDEAVTRITFPDGSFRDAVNNLALAVHNTSGEVIVLDESKMPGASQVAAIYRY
jgi:hypothetical protein